MGTNGHGHTLDGAVCNNLVVLQQLSSQFTNLVGFDPDTECVCGGGGGGCQVNPPKFEAYTYFQEI